MAGKRILLILLIAVAGVARSQKAEKYLDEISNLVNPHTSVYYSLDFKQKYLSDRDTTPFKAVVYLKKVKNDTVGYHFNIHNLTAGYQVVYDGKMIVSIQHKQKKCVIANPGTEGALSFIYGNVISNFIMGKLLDGSSWKNMTNDTSMTKITASFKKNKYDFKFEYADDEEIKNYSVQLLFDKVNCNYSHISKLNLEDMHQYTESHATQVRFDIETDSVLSFENFTSHDYEIQEYAPYVPVPLLRESSPAPRWKLNTLEGKTMSGDSLFGKVVLLDFWYRSCHPCIKLQPFLQQLYDEYNNKGLIIVGMNTADKDTAMLREFLVNRNITYPIALEAKNVAEKFKVTGYPTLYLINKEGKIAKTHIGYTENFIGEMRPVIDSLLKTKIPPYAHFFREARLLPAPYYFNFQDTQFGVIAGKKIIPHIYFDFDKSSLRPESLVMLDSLYEFMHKNVTVKIEISGHTDTRGNTEMYSQRLSLSRARAVVDYVIHKGISPERMMPQGYDKHEPLVIAEDLDVCGIKITKGTQLNQENVLKLSAGNKNCEECLHQLNRRICVRITSY